MNCHCQNGNYYTVKGGETLLMIKTVSRGYRRLTGR